MSSIPKLSEADIAAAINAIDKLAQQLHMTAEPDGRTVAFLVGLAEIVLRVSSQGALSKGVIDLGAAYATRLALRGRFMIDVSDEMVAYQAGHMAGAAMTGTLRADRDCLLLRTARSVSKAHGIMGVAEAIAVLVTGSVALPTERTMPSCAISVPRTI